MLECWSIYLLLQSGVPLTSGDPGGGGGLNPAELDGAQGGGGCGCRHKELPPFSLTGGAESKRSILVNVSNIYSLLFLILDFIPKNGVK